MSDIYPFQRSPYEQPGGESMLDKMMRAVRESRAIQVSVEEANGIPHKHTCRVVNGMHYAIRWCIVPGCMQSWRMPVRMDGIDEPIAEWEPIGEPVDLNSPVLPDYEG